MNTTMGHYENWLRSDAHHRLQLKKTEDGKHYVDPVAEFGWQAWRAAKKENVCPDCGSFDFKEYAVDDDCGTECECQKCGEIWRL